MPRVPGSPGHPPVGYFELLKAGGDPGRVIDARRGKRDAAGAEIERLARVGLELPPGTEGRRHQPGVARVGVGMPRDPRRPVRASSVVAQRKLLDQEQPARPAAPDDMPRPSPSHRHR